MATLKRRAEISPETTSKKVKGTYPPFHNSFRTSAADVLASECKDTDVFVPVKVTMIWLLDMGTKRCVSFEDMAVGQDRRRFKVFFTGRCMLLWHHLDLAIDDKILLSMKGASFNHTSLSQHDKINMPFRLAYEDGCIVKFIDRKGKRDAETVDLWNVNNNALVDTDADYTKDVVIFPPSSSQVFTQQNQSLEPREVNDTPVVPPAGLVHAPLPSQPNESLQLPNPQKKESAKEKRKKEFMAEKARRRQEKEALRQTKVPSPALQTPNDDYIVPIVSRPDDSEKNEAMPNNLDVPPIIYTQSVPDHFKQPIPPVRESEDIVEGSRETGEDPYITPESKFPALSLKAGWHEYRPLSYVMLPEALGKNHPVICVVTKSRTVNKSAGGDWSQSLNLIDPSNFLPSDAIRYRGGVGLSVNLFTRKYPEWLPTPKEGDVILLKTIKTVQNRNSVSAIVYHDRLKWTIYDPDTRMLHHGDRNDAPHSEGFDQGAGATLCPYFVPPGSRDELFYCEQLCEWWRAIMAKRKKDMGVIHQVQPSSTPHRIHRLISETNYDCEPDGYFNCTVQVLQGFQRDNGVYSLYVTDYTTNSGLPINNKWGDKLQNMVLRIEMWDDAAAIGPTMDRNGYYLLNNCRMMLKGGFLEGKIVENKIKKLDENTDTDYEAFVKMLERKEKMDKEPSAQPVAKLRIEDAESDKFFDCVVELIHKVTNASEAFIFVTDYTQNSEFLGCAPTGSWSAGLDGRVVKIKVYGDDNTKKVREMPVGSFYLLGKLRFWKYSTTWVCHLRETGSISRMNAKIVTDNDLKDLLIRREEWNNSRSSEHDIRHSDPELPNDSASAALPGPADFPLIEDYPSRFDVKACVVDFYPKRLEDSLALQCGRCNKQLRGLLKACPDCTEATMENAALVHRCVLFFMLRDRLGKEIVASACDPDCSLVKDINAENEEAYIDSLHNRLKPILGNLMEVHEGIERGKKIEVNTVEMKFDIICWLEKTDSGDKKRYAILNCTVA